MSSSSKGLERELFLSGLLRQVFPPHYRFGSGDIVDHAGVSSGQIDIVLEYPVSFSFPVFPDGPRLYMAESVAVAIEVKSDMRTQWKEVLQKGAAVAKVARRFTPQHIEEIAQSVLDGTSDYPLNGTREETAAQLRQIAGYFAGSSPRIPFYAVGFGGWTDVDTIRDHMASSPVDGVFIVNSQTFVTPEHVALEAESLITFLETLEKDLLAKTDRLNVSMNYFG